MGKTCNNETGRMRGQKDKERKNYGKVIRIVRLTRKVLIIKVIKNCKKQKSNQNLLNKPYLKVIKAQLKAEAIVKKLLNKPYLKVIKNSKKIQLSVLTESQSQGGLETKGGTQAEKQNTVSERVCLLNQNGQEIASRPT